MTAKAETFPSTPRALVRANPQPKAVTVVPAQSPLEEFPVGVFDDRRGRNLFLDVWKSCFRLNSKSEIVIYEFEVKFKFSLQ